MPSLLTGARSGKKLSDQIDFTRSLIKKPFDVVYNNESKSVTSIEYARKKAQSDKIKSQ